MLGLPVAMTESRGICRGVERASGRRGVCVAQLGHNSGQEEGRDPGALQREGGRRRKGQHEVRRCGLLLLLL